MEFLVFIIVVSLLLFFVLLKSSGKNRKKLLVAGLESDQIFYKKRGALFTPAERSFLGVLEKVVDERFQVFGKVRVADILTPGRGDRSEWQRAFNKISSKHFDYVLCRRSDLSVLCAIELNDGSHKQNHRQKRDEFLQRVCESADFPLFWFPVQQSYILTDVKNTLLGIIG